MKHATPLFIATVLIAQGCASSSNQRLEDIVPTRVYHRLYDEVFEDVKLYSLKEGFTLDRFGEEAGRIIGHKNTTSAREARQMSSSGETPMVVMALKLRKLTGGDTEVIVHFVFEKGHVVISPAEERMLLDCYATFFDYMQDKGGG